MSDKLLHISYCIASTDGAKVASLLWFSFKDHKYSYSTVICPSRQCYLCPPLSSFKDSFHTSPKATLTSRPSSTVWPSGGASLACVPGSNVEKIDPKSCKKAHLHVSLSWQYCQCQTFLTVTVLRRCFFFFILYIYRYSLQKHLCAPGVENMHSFSWILVCTIYINLHSFPLLKNYYSLISLFSHSFFLLLLIFLDQKITVSVTYEQD